ncbi:TetR/AcrR family transcriptional regulator [Nocardioides speluncae]|uniref:TetR/AcrR family transcriptional regulator n=1 Tax=Nocardioides speluncae TaxID=2670337 RepID=UPI00137A3A97|nr:TetR/AcrR family transcriptional regulator [Nocardioides speluncae]
MAPPTATQSLTAPDADWRQSVEVDLPPILSAALDAFSEQGFHGTSVRDIARRVGVTVPSLYYHHANKEAILVDLLNQSLDHVGRVCSAALAATGPAPHQRFFAMIEGLLRVVVHGGPLAMMHYELRALTEPERSVYAARRREFELQLTESIEQAAAAHIFDVTHPREASRAVLGMVQAIPVWYRPERGDMTPDEVADHYLDLIAHLVGASPGVITAVRAGTLSRQGSTLTD